MNIRIEGLSVQYGSRKILDSLSLAFNSGEFTGIIGPNGSGKSTLLKCIYRVLKPMNGNIYLNDKALKHFPLRESARQIAVLAQRNDFYFDFSVMDVVLMGRTPYKRVMESDNAEDKRIAREKIQQVGMEDFAHNNFCSLSGGEQQRIMLARALTQETPCLLLDEPTNHLDITYQLQLMNMICKMKLTVIAAVHDLNIAAMYCDRIIALKDGKVVAQGTPAEVLTVDFIYEFYHVHAQVVPVRDGRIAVVYERE
jgi:iron complex transport system ATP-binding protein